MLKILMTGLILMCSLFVLAQNTQSTLSYAYDASGNRISRQLEQSTSQQSLETLPVTFVVYPTIVSNLINVTAQDDITPDDYSYTITNVSGNILQTGVIQSQNTQISVSLLQGYYILNISSATGQQSFHFLKQ